MKRAYLMLLAALLVFSIAYPALGHGIIVPEDPRPVSGSYRIKSVSIDATVREQVADVRVAQVFVNQTSRQIEATYLFPIPPDATITGFTLLIDGKEHPAKMYTVEQARSIYEGIVRTKRDPALLQYMGYGALQASVFPLPPNGERRITLQYTQICRRDHDVTEFHFPLTTGRLSNKPIDELKFTARLESRGRIKSIYSPSHAIAAQPRTDEKSATVTFTQRNLVPADDLRVMWGLSEQPIGATLLTYRPVEAEDGYFLLLASPGVERTAGEGSAKTVVFVLDRSGSMSGKKIEQAKGALKFVLNNLREGDTFNIVVYDDKVESFKPELQRMDEATRAEAVRYVDAIHDGGSTNIDGALKRAMELVGDTSRPSYIIFLTDGLPTSSVVSEPAIAANAKSANRSKARLFAFGVGFDVNARLLDRLTTENFGVSEYVRPNEDIEASVSKFYGRLTAPVFTNVKLAISHAKIDTMTSPNVVNRLYPAGLPDLFAGGQIVAVGRYGGSGESTIRLSGKVGDRERTFEFPAMLAHHSADQTYGFVEKLWASRRIGEIINELDLRGRNQELIDELVRLSTKHGILTPYTAFLADERTDLHATIDNTVRAEQMAFDNDETSISRNITGETSVNLRHSKGELQQQAQAGAGQGAYREADGKMRKVETLQVVANQAMYKRGALWVDPTVTDEERKSAEQVEQFSERYFELARTNGNLRPFLSMPEGCLIKMDGRVYQVNSPQAKGG